MVINELERISSAIVWKLLSMVSVVVEISKSYFRLSINISRIRIPASGITVPGPKMATAPAS